MDSVSLIADLSNSYDRPASIFFQNIDLCASSPADVSPGLLGFYRVSDAPFSSGLIDDHSFCDDQHRKAFYKGKKTAIRVAQLLNGKP
jgi:hypothetical protein